jgi:hypothetical protein
VSNPQAPSAQADGACGLLLIFPPLDRLLQKCAAAFPETLEGFLLIGI